MIPPYSIDTERVVIRRFVKTDLGYFIEFMTNSRITNNLAFSDESKTKQGAEDLLELTINSYNSDLPLMAFAIENKANGEFIGACGFNPLNDLEVEVFYALFPDSWGKGFATEVLKALKGFIFAKTNHSAIKAFIKKENSSSKKVAFKNNFQDMGLVENKNFSDKVHLFLLRKE